MTRSMHSLYVRLLTLLPQLPEEEEGQGLAEYALILVLIAVVCFVALQFLGTQVSTVLSTIGSSL